MSTKLVTKVYKFQAKHDNPPETIPYLLPQWLRLKTTAQGIHHSESSWLEDLWI